MAETPERGWLPEARPAPRRGVLEDTLFRRLEDLRRKPPADLVELVERTLEVLRATKEALLEQRQEIRSLAASVETLRGRVDRLVHHPPPEPAPLETAASALPPPAEAPSEEPLGPPVSPPPVVDEAPAQDHLLLLGLPTGYRLVAGSGPPPVSRARLFVDGVAFEVVGEKSSPLPGETRRIVFALPAGASARAEEL
jgi:hypothetical protein